VPKRPAEGLGHTVRLRTFNGRSAHYKASVAGEPARAMCGIAAAIVGETLDRLCELGRLPEPLYGTHTHKVADVAGADAADRRYEVAVG
jgi:hypothetical protein